MSTTEPLSGSSYRSKSRASVPGRLFVALLALVLVAAACGGDGDRPEAQGGANGGADAAKCPTDALKDADEPVDITVWHAWVGKTAQTIESMAEAYNDSQDKVVVHVESQGTYEEMLKKYTDAMADPASLPDLVMNVDTALQFMIDSNTAIPAAACIKSDPDSKKFYDAVLPAVTSGYTVKGTLWPAAFSVSEPVLYINQNHFAAAGLSTDDLPRNLDELRSASQKIMDAKKAGVPALQSVTEPMVLRLDSWYLEHWMTGAAEPIVNEDNGRSGLATKTLMDAPDVTRSFEWFKSMTDDGLLKSVPYSKPYDQLFAMALQSSSMLIDTSTAITTVDAAIEGTLTNEEVGAEDLGIDLSTFKFDTLSIGVGLNPGFETAGRGQIGGAAWYIIDSSDPASIAATWDFVKYSNQTPQQVRWTLDGSYLPILEPALNDPAVQSEFSSTRRGKWLAIASDGLKQLDPEHPGPVIGPYNEFRSIYRIALEKVTLQGAPVDATVKDSNEKFQKALDQYRVDVGG